MIINGRRSKGWTELNRENSSQIHPKTIIGAAALAVTAYVLFITCACF